MKVGYIGGFWSTNIGNAFYNLGAIWLLEKIYGKKNVFFIPDPPQVYWNSLENDYDLISKLDLNLIIISGPILGYNLEHIYGRIFEQITRIGCAIGFLSAGAVLYSEKEADSVSNFLNKYNVSFMFTRDSDTYNLYSKRLDTLVVDGLCTSMFLNDAFVPANVIDHDYVVFNFPYFCDPIIKILDSKWIVKKRMFSHVQKNVLGYPVVRIKSSPYIPNIKFLKSTLLVYPRKNMYYSDLPHGYLSILSAAQYVFSDRVHTCAAGLILGAKCMYIKSNSRSKDGRNKLFLRLNLPEIYDKPISIDYAYIKNEKKTMIKQLSLHHSNLG
jgi:hypothetical protein